MTDRLDTMQPADDWQATPYEEAIEAFRRHGDDLVIRVWGGDWCQDCRAVLPAFAAALEAAGIAPETVHQYPVTKAEDGSKQGPLVDEYEITLIPTIVLEREGDEIARFEESAEQAAVRALARELANWTRSVNTQ